MKNRIKDRLDSLESKGRSHGVILVVRNMFNPYRDRPAFRGYRAYWPDGAQDYPGDNAEALKEQIQAEADSRQPPITALRVLELAEFDDDEAQG